MPSHLALPDCCALPHILPSNAACPAMPPAQQCRLPCLALPCLSLRALLCPARLPAHLRCPSLPACLALSCPPALPACPAQPCPDLTYPLALPCPALHRLIACFALPALLPSLAMKVCPPSCPALPACLSLTACFALTACSHARLTSPNLPAYLALTCPPALPYICRLPYPALHDCLDLPCPPALTCPARLTACLAPPCLHALHDCPDTYPAL
jgi:hypothetical protein